MGLSENRRTAMGRGGCANPSASVAIGDVQQSFVKKILIALRQGGQMDRTVAVAKKIEVPPGTLPHHEEAVKLALSDVHAIRNEYMFSAPVSWTKFLDNDKDLPMLSCIFNITVLILPLCASLFFLTEGSLLCHLCCIAFEVYVWLIWGNRFILCLHYAEHRRLFGKQMGTVGEILNKFPPFVLSAFWGIPPGFYNLHHVCMHHAENNMFPTDLSSTMPYSRGNFLHFLMYVINYVVNTSWYLPVYAAWKKRWPQFFQFWAGAGVYYYWYVAARSINSTVANYVLVLPFCMASFFLMLGNFSQHLFVDTKDHKNNYKLTYNLIGSRINQITFNDGYHIVHHENSRCHWSEMPDRFITNIEKYEKQDALLFNGLTYEEVSFLVWSGKFSQLAQHVVQVREQRRSLSEVEDLLKSRLQPIR